MNISQIPHFLTQQGKVPVTKYIENIRKVIIALSSLYSDLDIIPDSTNDLERHHS